MTPYYADAAVTLYAADCLDVLRGMPDGSVDAVVTDPPAGIAFMSKTWDGARGGRVQWSAWLAEVMRECYRVAKPGAHALVWALPRTSHWTACGIEDAGWEIRDRISHIFGSGFPKSLDVGKAIDKAAGAEREVIGRKTDPRYASPGGTSSGVPMGNLDARANGAALYEAAGNLTAPATDAAKQWQGWGTALKPGAEDWWVARKPLAGTVAANVQQFGTGALNVAACRVGGSDVEAGRRRHGGGVVGNGSSYEMPDSHGEMPAGRWPPNVVLVHSPGCEQACAEGCPVAELDRQSGVGVSGADRPLRGTGGIWSPSADGVPCGPQYGDTGGASRFFPTFRYEAKAPTHERPKERQAVGYHSATGYGRSMRPRLCNVCGSRTGPQKQGGPWPNCGHDDWVWVEPQSVADTFTTHPTVKPLGLMRWLVRLITPPGGICLDLFAGSGTTGEACVIEGFRCILVEKDPDYLPLIVARLSKPIQPDMFGGAV